MRNNRKKRNLFLHKNLQGKIIFQSFLLAIASALIFTVILGLLSSDHLTISYENSHLSIGKTPLMLAKEILQAQWVFILTGGLLVGFVTLIISHRIAGPLYRFEKALDAMAEGDFQHKVTLRPGDTCQELADQFNRVNTKLSADLAEIGTCCDSIEKNLLHSKEQEALQQTRDLKKLLEKYREK